MDIAKFKELRAGDRVRIDHNFYLRIVRPGGTFHRVVFERIMQVGWSTRKQRELIESCQELSVEEAFAIEDQIEGGR